MSKMSAWVAVVFMEPGAACDRETSWPAWSRADLRGSVFSGELEPRAAGGLDARNLVQ